MPQVSYTKEEHNMNFFKKSPQKLIKESIFVKQTKGHLIIQKTREYLDYLEEHLTNVALAFDELSKACDGMCWVGDDYCWHTLREQVVLHDVSKFSPEEFVQYRKSFFPVDELEKETSNFTSAWEHHKDNNHHHWETASNDLDIVHMIIDWTAMGYKFGGTAQEYYEKNRHKIKVPENYISYMYEIFDRLTKYRNSTCQH